MYCAKCGKMIEGGAKFCPQCGNNLDSTVPDNSNSEESKSLRTCHTDELNHSNSDKSSIFDIFHIKGYKKRISELEAEVERLNSYMTPEMKDIQKAKQILKDIESEQDKQHKILADCEEKSLKKIEELKASIKGLDDTIKQKSEELKAKNKELICLDEEITLQSFGLYAPKYEFDNSDEYKAKLIDIRKHQKTMIKNGTAVTGNQNWTVNGNAAQGRKMIKDMQKLLLRAFNSECDEVIDRVKFNTYETAERRIESSFEAISKLGKVMDVAISYPYYSSKLEELDLAFEYRMKKQEEKELQKELRAQMREDARLQREIEAERKKIEKERSHYKNAMSTLEAQIAAATGEEKIALLSKKKEIEEQLVDIDKAMKDIDYREANQRAGYVYIISNIGSFGENIFKIGMTRRLDPTERVSELGDASVPFNFDIHAMIFSDDAPALEAALHRAFEDRKLNMVNTRREFFNVTLDEIKEVVKNNFDKTVEFIEMPDAEQYRISQKMKQSDAGKI